MKRCTFSLSIAALFALFATAFVESAHAQNRYNNDPGCAPPGSRTGSPSGKHVMKHPVVSLIFWGNQWPTPPQPGSSAGQITGALQDLMAGPYFTWLNQYGQAGSPRLFASVLYKNNEPTPTRFTTNQVEALIKSQLGTTVPQADSNQDNLYYVILPNGSQQDKTHDTTPCNSQEGSGLGCHYYDTAPNGQRYYFVWSVVSNMLDMDIVSHELAEVITDPDVNWDIGNGDEISDVCGSGLLDCVRDVTVGPNQAFWYSYSGFYSVLDQRCITPYSWQQIDRYFPPNEPGCNGQARCWGTVSSGDHTFTAGGLYASGHGRVHADPNGLWLHYSDQFSDFNLGQGVFSMVAVSDRAVYGLTLDQSAIFQWTPAFGWIGIGAQATSIYAGSKGLVAVQPNDLAAGGGSKSFFLDDSTNTWSQIDTVPVSMFAVNGDGIYELQANPNEIWKYNNAWSQLSPSVSVDISASVGLLARIGASPRDTYTVWTNGRNWVHQKASDPYDIAVINNNLFWMQPDRNNIFQSDNVSATNPHFTAIGWGGHLFRGSTTNLFAAGFWTTD